MYDDLVDSSDQSCPYCGEAIEILLDLSGGSQSYIEDCQVCCRPIQIQLSVIDNDTYTVRLLRDDEA